MAQKKFEIDESEILLATTLKQGHPGKVVLEVAMTPSDFNPQRLHPKGKEGFNKTVAECLRDCAVEHNYTIAGSNIRPKAHNIKTGILSFQFDVRKERTLMPTG